MWAGGLLVVVVVVVMVEGSEGTPETQSSQHCEWVDVRGV